MNPLCIIPASVINNSWPVLFHLLPFLWDHFEQIRHRIMYSNCFTVSLKDNKWLHLKMSIRSCHFTLKTTLSLYCSCKVLLHLAFALLSSSASCVFPFDQYSLAALAFFLFSGLTGMFLPVWGFPTCCRSPSQLFPGSSPDRFHLILHSFASNAALSEDCSLITLYSWPLQLLSLYFTRLQCTLK